jgi:3-hydroxyacyl-CoA dehydrogenase
MPPVSGGNKYVRSMKRSIRKVAVLGSGVMGSAIACHFANIGCQVMLLDIAPKELTEEEKAKGLTLESKAVRNRLVQSSFDRSIKSNPGPLYSKKIYFPDHSRQLFG